MTSGSQEGERCQGPLAWDRGAGGICPSAHCPVPDTNSITNSTLAVINRMFRSTITDFFYSQRSPGVLAILGGKITMGRHVQLQKKQLWF